jgi:rhodanese-related sulfurtransferase
MKASAACLFLAPLIFGAHAAGQQMVLADQLNLLQVSSSAFVLIDARPSIDFQHQHIDGALSIPPGDSLKTSWPKEQLLVIYCGDARCPLSHEAARRFVANGYQNVKILYGGFDEWRHKGYPVVPSDAAIQTDGGNHNEAVAENIRPIELTRQMKVLHNAVIILDLRSAQEFMAGHLPGALSIPLERLTPSAFANDKKVVVYDRLPERSLIGARMLMNAGVSAKVLLGGVAVWSQSGYPLIVGISGS